MYYMPMKIYLKRRKCLKEFMIYKTRLQVSKAHDYNCLCNNISNDIATKYQHHLNMTYCERLERFDIQLLSPAIEIC